MSKNYEIFKDALVNHFKEYLPFEYQKATYTILNSDDGELLKITLEGANTSYIEVAPIYKELMATMDYDKVFTDAAQKMVASAPKKESPTDKDGNKVDIDDLIDINAVSKRIILQLVSPESQEEVINEIPHRPWKDLLIVYRMITGIMNDGTYTSVPVNDGMLMQLKMSENQLFEIAYENTKKYLEPKCYTQLEMQRKAMLNDAREAGVNNIDGSAIEITPEIIKENVIWTLSNEASQYGAVGILYEDALSELADTIESSLYLVPVNTHEFFVVRDNEITPQELYDSVYNTAKQNGKEKEMLSKSVYYFSRKNKYITIVNPQDIEKTQFPNFKKGKSR